jgi:acyl carrier protein
MFMTTRDDVRDKVAALLALDAGSIDESAPLFALADSSFRIVELVIELQEEFGVLFGQADMNQVATVGDLFDLVVARKRTDHG